MRLREKRLFCGSLRTSPGLQPIVFVSVLVVFHSMLRGRMRPFVILKAPALPRTVIFFFFTRFEKLRSLLLVDPNYAHFWPRIIMNLQDPGALTAILPSLTRPDPQKANCPKIRPCAKFKSAVSLLVH